MDTRRLLSVTVLYGAADVIVMAVGGFLLLPLYTRTLSPTEFGTYVVVKANAEIFTYLLALGLPTAVSRVYFDYRSTGQQASYINSILVFFGLCLVVLLLVLAIWGDRVWTLLSPTVPSMPYLALVVAMACTGFLSTLGTLWLRLDGRARTFALAQLGAAAILIVCAWSALVVLSLGLPGLLAALLVSSVATALLLPWQLGRAMRPQLHWQHVRDSLPFAGPSLLAYMAYFFLNRMSTLVLQRHVPLDEVAVFGLSQQLAMIVTMAAGAFGKAQQPVVFGAPANQADALLNRAGRVLRLMMLGVTGLLLLFSAELVALVAPARYGQGVHILSILLVANFAASFTQISDTALLYHRRPKLSLLVSLSGALVSVGLCLLLIPTLHGTGAALAVAGTSICTTIVSHALAWRVSGQSWFGPLFTGLLAAGALALAANALPLLGLDQAWLYGLKLLLFGAVAGGIALRLQRH